MSYDHSLFNCATAFNPAEAGDGFCDSCDPDDDDCPNNNVSPCFDGGDCCAWSCEANCASGNCPYECGRDKHTSSRRRSYKSGGYDCVDPRYSECVWGGACYDDARTPGTVLLFGLAITFLVVGVLFCVRFQPACG